MERQEPDRRALGRKAFVERVWAWKAESGGAIVPSSSASAPPATGAASASPSTKACRARSPRCSCSSIARGSSTRTSASSTGTRSSRPRSRTSRSCRSRRKGSFKWSRDDGAPLDAAALAKVLAKNPNGHLYYFEYPVVDDEGEETGERVTVATTRPETMLGDTAVAVHPDDRALSASDRQAHVRLPLVGRLIAIVADEYSDPEKGTGAVKITPAHDFNDFEVGKRHEAEGARPINILDAQGRVTLEGQCRLLRRPRERPRPRPADRRGRRPGPLRRARADRRDDGARGSPRQDRAARARGAARRPLERGHRALAHRPMVCRRQDARRAGDRGRARGRDPVRPEDLGEDLFRLAREHPAVVRFAPALVGTSDPGLVLALGRGLCRGDGGRGLRRGARRRRRARRA